MRYRVSTPQSDFRGEVAGVAFFDGSAEVDETRLAALAYFRRRGYHMEAVQPPSAAPQESPAADLSKPRRSASKTDWQAYAIAHGVPQDEAEQLTRDQLAERFPDSEGDLQ